MRKLLFLMQKEFIQFKRSKAMVAITFGVPVVQLVLLGFAISGDIENIPTVIVDLDHSKTSREIAEKLENSDYFDVRRYETDMRETVRLMKEDEIIIAVTVPRDFERKLLRGEHPALSISADAQNTTVAITGVGYVRRIMQSMAERRISQSDLPNLSRIIITPRIRYNEEMKNVFYMDKTCLY